MDERENFYRNGVVTLVADEAYVPHAKSVMVNCRREGAWDGDFCLILPPEVDAEYFTSRGIVVLADPAPVHYRKYALFDQFFNQKYPNRRGNPQQRWDTVLYLDADVYVHAPLGPLFHEVGWGRILADLEPFTMRHAFEYWTTGPGYVEAPNAKELTKWLWENHDSEGQQFCTSIMLYHPRTMPTDAREQLTALNEKLAPINTHVRKGTDQPIINLAFSGTFDQVRSDLFCYWQSAWEGTVISHFCSHYAGWVKKNPDQAAYWNFKPDRPLHDLYIENLEAFEDTFPVKT